jgi:hypothetical protein
VWPPLGWNLPSRRLAHGHSSALQRPVSPQASDIDSPSPHELWVVKGKVQWPSFFMTRSHWVSCAAEPVLETRCLLPMAFLKDQK